MCNIVAVIGAILSILRYAPNQSEWRRVYCPSNGHTEIDWPEDSGYWMMGGTEEKKLCDESETNASEDGWTERLKR